MSYTENTKSFTVDYASQIQIAINATLSKITIFVPFVWFVHFIEKKYYYH